jgi:hypothetical protein
LPVERLGVRHKLGVPFDGAYEVLLDHLSKNYVQLAPRLQESLHDAHLVDIGAPLNFTDNVGNFNTSVGPVKEAQLRDFLGKREGIPAIGVYIDVDYWVKPGGLLTDSETVAKVSAFAAAAYRRAEILRELTTVATSVAAPS